MALRWYVVHAYSNFEHRVAEGLKDRIKMQGLQDKFGEILVPTEEVVEMRDGPEAQERPQVLPRLRAGADGNGRVDLAPGEGSAEGARLHRRHAGKARADHREGSA